MTRQVDLCEACAARAVEAVRIILDLGMSDRSTLTDIRICLAEAESKCREHRLPRG